MSTFDSYLFFTDVRGEKVVDVKFIKNLFIDAVNPAYPLDHPGGIELYPSEMASVATKISKFSFMTRLFSWVASEPVYLKTLVVSFKCSYSTRT
jgi:hypothetical protein